MAQTEPAVFDVFLQTTGKQKYHKYPRSWVKLPLSWLELCFTSQLTAKVTGKQDLRLMSQPKVLEMLHKLEILEKLSIKS